MPYKWNRTINGQFSEDLNAAIAARQPEEIVKKTSKIDETPNQYSAPMSPEGQRVEKLSSVMAHSIFNAQEESDLAEYVRQCSRIYYGLSMKDLQHIGFSYGHAKLAGDADIVDFQPHDGTRLGRRLQEAQ